MENKIQYFELFELINNNLNNTDVLNKIKTKYIKLLTFLTETNDLQLYDFIKQLKKINDMGKIVVGIFGNLFNSFEIVGTGTLIFEPKIIHNSCSVAHIEDIVVHPDFRNKGIAKHIIDTFKTLSKNNNCYKIILNCKDEYIAIYEKFGFVKKNNEMSHYFD